MIADARVLRPEFIPSEVVHRDAQIDHLTHALDPITHGERGETAFLVGPSGSGKTCIARYTVDKLRESVLDIEHQYVNCWEDHSRFKALYRVLDGLNRTIDIHRQSTPTDVLLDRLRDYEGPPYVIILDETDQLADPALLYDLSAIPTLQLILIANREEELFSRLDGRVRSRLASCERVRFDRYTVDELVAILRDRATRGLVAGAIADDELALVADAAAGDARAGIGILRAAARRARREQTERITVALIDEAIPDAATELRRGSLDRLTAHQRTLYEIIQEAEEITPGTLYDRYAERVAEPKTKRTMRAYLSKLEHYNLVNATGETKARTYHVRESAIGD